MLSLRGPLLCSLLTKAACAVGALGGGQIRTCGRAGRAGRAGSAHPGDQAPLHRRGLQARLSFCGVASVSPQNTRNLWAAGLSACFPHSLSPWHGVKGLASAGIIHGGRSLSLSLKSMTHALSQVFKCGHAPHLLSPCSISLSLSLLLKAEQSLCR